MLGTFLTELRAPGAAAALRHAGFEFFLLDTEHGYYSPHDVTELMLTGKRHGICPFVRVSAPTHGEITHALDAGAEGILIPMVRSLDEVGRAVAQSKYVPLGVRGVHFLRPHTGFDPPADAQAFMDQANRTLITAVQIETPEAVDLIPDIAAVDGVDMLYLGPGDLSVAMGLGLAADHPRVLAVADRIVEACAQHGKMAAGHVGSPEHALKYIEKGMNVIGYGAALRLLRNGAAGYVESLQHLLSAAAEPRP